MRPIIIEGIDGVGKTTLFHKFRQINSTWGNFPSEGKPSTRTELKARIERLINHPYEDNPRVNLYDRHCLISEPIYGPILRNETMIEELKAIKLLKMINPIIIYCGVSDRNLLKNKDYIKKVHKSEEQWNLVKQNVGTIQDKYQNYMNLLIKNHIQVFPVCPLTQNTVELALLLNPFLRD